MPETLSSSVITVADATTSLDWEGLASVEQQAAILPILDELETAFHGAFDLFSPCLSRGTAGVALFLGYLSKLEGKAHLIERSAELLNQAIKRVDRMPGAQFYSGYSGVAWTVEHIQRELLGIQHTAEGEDANEDVDEMLLRFLEANKPWRDGYDLSGGLVGYGVYALERLNHPTARLLLARVLDHLEALAMETPEGFTWPTPIDLMRPWQVKNAPKGCFNLGLAHGIPSVILLLAAIRHAGREHSSLDGRKASRLLEGGMAWLLGKLNPPFLEENRLPDLCPNGIGIKGPNPKGKESACYSGNRLAWSYGDLGASLAMLQTAILTERPDWKAKAMEIALHAASRPLAASGVMDAGLNHGSGGNMVIFQRLFQLTGDPQFKQAAQVYLDHLLNTRKSGNPFAGYMCWHPDDPTDTLKSDPGLLEGAAGAGLALLSALGVEPAWARFMMLCVK